MPNYASAFGVGNLGSSRYATRKDMEKLGFLNGGGPGSSGGTAMQNEFGLGTIRNDNIPSMTATGNFLGGGQPSAPTNPNAELKARYDRGEIGIEELLKAYTLDTRNPAITSATTKAMGDIAATDAGAGLLDFNKLKSQFSAGDQEMADRYSKYQKGNNIDEYTTQTRAGLDEAKAVIDRYRTEGVSSQDRVLKNAEDFYNKDIPQSIRDAQNQAVQYTSRYGIGRGGGLSSAIGTISGDAAVRASLPFQREGRGFMDSALRGYAPLYGDIAARDYNRIANLNIPTEHAIKNLDLMVKERGYNAAVQNLKNQGLSQSLINELVQSWQRNKSGSLGLTGQAAEMEQRYGAERGYNYLPGTGPITQPQYFGSPQPNFPQNFPGRYPVSNPQSSFNPGAGAAPEAPGASSNEQRIQEVMNYTQRKGMPNNYGGQYPNAGTGDWKTGYASGNYLTGESYRPDDGVGYNWMGAN